MSKMRKIIIPLTLFVGTVIWGTNYVLAAPVISSATPSCSASGISQVTVNWSGGTGGDDAIEIKQGNVSTHSLPLWWKYISSISPAVVGTGQFGQSSAGELPYLVLTGGTTYTVWTWDGTSYSNSRTFVAATCTPVPYTLTTTVLPVGGGTVTGGGTYNAGTVIPITAYPAAGYTFNSWSATGDLNQADPINPNSITIRSSQSVTAAFSGSAPTYNFSLSSSGSINIPVGSSGSQTINLTGSGTFPSAVSFTVSGLPTGVTASFSPASVDLNTGSGSSVITVNVPINTTPGNSVVTVTGTVGSVTRTTTFDLTVGAVRESDHTENWFPDNNSPWPAGWSAPNDNRPTPLNMSNRAQTKEGWLGVGLTGVPMFPLEVFGPSFINGVLGIGPGGDRLTVNGNISYTGTLTPPASDLRLKTNISSLPDTLSKVLKLRPVTFNWKDSSRGTDTQIGLIAQDVAPLFPEVISTNPESGYLGVDYSKLAVSLIKAIQEKQQIIDTLNQRIGALEKVR